MGEFLGCTLQCAWEAEILLILTVVAANTLAAALSTKGFFPAVSSPFSLQQPQLPFPATSQLLEVLLEKVFV